MKAKVGKYFIAVVSSFGSQEKHRILIKITRVQGIDIDYEMLSKTSNRKIYKDNNIGYFELIQKAKENNKVEDWCYE